jgi:AcrR family transcriptional regulator
MNERSFVLNEGSIMTVSSPTRGEQTRTAILQAAHDLFVKQGYHGTSMRQIAQQANLALGGLYNHFPGKEQVFEAVFLTFHPYHEVLPLITTARGSNLEELIQNAIQRMVQAVEGRPDFMNLMFIEVVEFKSTHAQQLFANLFPQGMQILQHLVGAYPEQVRSIPASMLVRTFLGLFFGYYLTETALAPNAPPEFRENAMQYFVDIYLHGILAPTGLKR